MAENSNGKSLRTVDTSDLADELLRRMKLSDDEAKKFKLAVMKQSGYDVVPQFVKKPRDEKKSSGWSLFGGSSDNDDDESDDL